MIETQKPRITLISWTPKPVHQLAWACGNYKGITVRSLDEVPGAIRNSGFKSAGEEMFQAPTDDEVMEAYIRPFLKDPTAAGLEFIQMVFLLENVSRAFQQQITRHRLASFIIQSLRVHNVGKFASEGRYTMPSTVKNPQAFHEEMLNIEGAYNKAVESGENIEDARGLLPLNVHSTITMRIDMKALHGLMLGRLCLTAQEEARRVGYAIKREVTDKMGDFFGGILQPPCHANHGGKCTRTNEYCGVPLYLASENPARFKEWYAKNGGKPDGSRVPTNTVILPEDLEQVELALAEASK